MADDIVDITFTDVRIENGSTNTFATITGTIAVDYTTDTVSGSLTAAVPAENPPSENFTTFQLTQQTSPYTVDAANAAGSLSFSYSGTQPTSLLSGSLFLELGSVTYDVLVSNVLTSNPVCYVEGTLIRKAQGDAPVETLQVGDLVQTSSGELRPVKWLGHRVIDCRTHANPRLVRPIRIAEDAFGPNRPSQDLYVSTGHSICIDLCGEVLIPAANLVNGATIAQIEVDEVSYWHVELDSHDILIANNLPAESYMEMGNRGFFDEARTPLDAFDRGQEKTHADFCRPVVLDGPVLAFARQRLMARAEAIGWTPSREADLHLLVDGEVHRPLTQGDTAVFLFPAGARDVRLKANVFVPALVGGADPRALGVMLHGLVFSGSRGAPHTVSLDDERLQDGLHPEERRSASPWRWTKGELTLCPDFWSGLSGRVALLVTHEGEVTRGWIAPAKLEAENRPRLRVVRSATVG
jgi:hypothetical protein